MRPDRNIFGAMNLVNLISQLEETKFLRLFRYLVDLRDERLYSDNLCLPSKALDLPDVEMVVRTIGKVSALSSWAMTWVFQIEHLPACLWNGPAAELFFERQLKVAFRNLKAKPDPIDFLQGEFNSDSNPNRVAIQYPRSLNIDYYLFTNICCDLGDDAVRRFSDKADKMFAEIVGIPASGAIRFGVGTPESVFNHSQSAVEKFIVDLLNTPSSYYFLAREGKISVVPITEHGAFFASHERPQSENQAKGLSTVITSALSSSSHLCFNKIADLEYLINNPRTKEADLQEFFRTNPQFLFAMDERYCEIRPHVCLLDDKRNRLVPDFMARIEDSDIWDVIELKRPQHSFTNKTNEFRKISARAARGIAELLEYRDYFASRANRKRVTDLFETAPYEPALVLVIGRERARSRYEWRSTRLGFPRVEVVSYDYLFRRAEECRAFLAQHKP